MQSSPDIAGGVTFMTLEDIYGFVRWLARRYQCSTGGYLQAVGFTADDLASLIFERLLRYNREYIDRRQINTGLLYTIAVRHAAAIMRREYAYRKRETEHASDIVVESPITGFIDSQHVIALLESRARSELERGIVAVLRDPSPYWEWAAYRYKDNRQPTLNRLARYLNTSFYEVRKAVGNLKPTLIHEGGYTLC